MVTRMVFNQTVHFGRGAIRELPAEIVDRDLHHALVVTDAGLVSAGVVAPVTNLLVAAGVTCTVFDDVRPNPTTDVVTSGVEAFRASGADCLVAIGGGSSQDTAKAIGLVLAAPGHTDLRAVASAPVTGLVSVPVFAVPTTGGAGAEASTSSVLLDPRSQRVVVCTHPRDIPLVAIVDADLMRGMPPALKVTTGIDALAHAIEGYTTRAAWEVSDLVNLRAIEIIGRNLAGSVAGDEAACEQVALGQYLAGLGASNVGLGLAHAMTHPLSARYDTPHGLAAGVLLPHVMAFNAPSIDQKLRDVAGALGVPDADTLGREEASEAAVVAVVQLATDLGVPARLRTIGVLERDLPELASAALDDACAAQNPRDVGFDDVLGLYIAVF